MKRTRRLILSCLLLFLLLLTACGQRELCTRYPLTV